MILWAIWLTTQQFQFGYIRQKMNESNDSLPRRNDVWQCQTSILWCDRYTLRNKQRHNKWISYTCDDGRTTNEPNTQVYVRMELHNDRTGITNWKRREFCFGWLSRAIRSPPTTFFDWESRIGRYLQVLFFTKSRMQGRQMSLRQTREYQTINAKEFDESS